MNQKYQSSNSDGLYPSASRCILIDRMRQTAQNIRVAFNQATGFSSPNTTWQTSRRYPLSGGVFTSAFPCCTFSNGKQGNGRPCACWKHVVQSANPFLLFPTHTFSSVKAGLKNQREKVHLIMTKIRQGYSRPLIIHSIRNFSSLSEACRFVDRLTASNGSPYRFNIQQTAPDSWTVSRVVSGGAA